MSEPLPAPLNLLELEAHAARALSRSAYDYYRSGAHDEVTLRRNREAFEERSLAYRVLVDVRARDLSSELFGRKIAMPVLIAPTAFHRMAHPEGELATARAAGAAGIPMVLSTLSNTRVEEVAEVATSPLWFQLYIYKDRGATAALVRRVTEAGCQALVLTVDAPLLGTRERDKRNRFALPEGLSVANMDASGLGALTRQAADSGLAAYVAELLDPGLTYADLEWLRSITDLPILVKGVVRADDAAHCVRSGAAGVIVSNHGGRQLDTSPATIEVLEEVAEAARAVPASGSATGEGAVVLLDGGVRRGTDVLKALALGADAVLIGRPILWALAWDGQRGVEAALAMLREELDLALALAGCPNLSAVSRDLIR